jgi:hypothetical protein
VVHQKARLDALAEEAELFHEDGADGEVEVAVCADVDLAAGRQREPSMLLGTVTPQRRCDVVWDEYARWGGRALRLEAPRT